MKAAAKSDSGNPELDELHKAAQTVAEAIEASSGMRTVTDGPTHGLELGEVYQKIVQDDDELEGLKTPPPDVHAKDNTLQKKGSIIDLTAGSSSDESLKANSSRKVVIKKEEEDTKAVREKLKGKGAATSANVDGTKNIVAKTYPHGEGKVTGKVGATETVLGAVASHLSAEAQEKRDISRFNLYRESCQQDRQDRVLEEREKEISRTIERLQQENNALRERATAAETTLNLFCSIYGLQSSAPPVYPPGPTGPVQPAVRGPAGSIQPAVRGPAVPPFVANPNQFVVPLTTRPANPEPEGIAGPGPRTMEYRRGGIEADEPRDGEKSAEE